MTQATIAAATSAELSARYWREGYVLVPGLFEPEEVESWRRECTRLWALLDLETDSARIQWRGHAAQGQIRDRIDPVVDISPVFAALAADPRLVGAARDVLRAEPALMKAKLIAKRSGTAGYGMHQDFPYWAPLGVPADDLLTVQVGIDASTRDNGAVEVFGRLHHRTLEAPEGHPLDVDETRIDLSRGEVVELAAGDLLFFHSLTPHRSGPNQTGGSRRALFLSYATESHGDVYGQYHAQQRVKG